MTFFEPVVLGNIVQIIPPHHDCIFHFCGHNHAFEYPSSNGHATCEWAFPVDVSAFDGFLGSFEAQTNVFPVTNTFCGLFGEELLGPKRDNFLLLESFFSLDVGHFCMEKVGLG